MSDVYREVNELSILLEQTRQANGVTEVENYSLMHEICLTDVTTLREKGASYGPSWRQRGGSNAFHMMARKWDRLENGVKEYHDDIFAFAIDDNREESVLDDIGDLRRYLLLIEGHLRSLLACRAAVRKREEATLSPLDLFKRLPEGAQIHEPLLLALPKELIETHTIPTGKHREIRTKKMFGHGGPWAPLVQQGKIEPITVPIEQRISMDYDEDVNKNKAVSVAEFLFTQLDPGGEVDKKVYDLLSEDSKMQIKQVISTKGGIKYFKEKPKMDPETDKYILTEAEAVAVSHFVHEVKKGERVQDNCANCLPQSLLDMCCEQNRDDRTGDLYYVKRRHPRIADHPEIHEIVDLTPRHRDVDDGVNYEKDEPAE